MITLSAIWYFNAGWRYTIHDDRVSRNSMIIHKLDEHFCETEYIIGDNGYNHMVFLISKYKQPIDAPLQLDKKGGFPHQNNENKE